MLYQMRMNKTDFIKYFLILTVFTVGFVRCNDDLPSADALTDDEEQHEPPKYVITNEVFLDVEIRPTKTSEAIKSGRIVIGLFGDVCPMTATNFLQLAKGFKRDNVKIENKIINNYQQKLF